MTNLFENSVKMIPKDRPTIMNTEEKYCDKCGRKYTHAFFSDGSETKVGCDCEMIALAKEKTETYKKKRKQEKANEVFKNSLINRKTSQARFDNYQPTNENLAKALKIAEKYVEKFDTEETRSLYFHGSFGTGKSHLSYAIAHNVKEKGYTVLFMNIPQLITLIKSTYSKNSKVNEFEIMEMIADVDLMVFDDIGVSVNDFALSKLFEMIDSRIGKNNIYTTNLTAEEISKDKDWQRIFSRIVDDSHIIDMNGDDYRLRGIKNDK